jgi:hypothetical protein
VRAAAAFGRRPWRTRHRRSWPGSETLRTSRHSLTVAHTLLAKFQYVIV